jgi:RimJ/RimL family protein N-acetyltransferase
MPAGSMTSPSIAEIRTERLWLRPWHDRDLDAFAAINADPTVMEYFPASIARAQSDELAVRIRAGFLEHGFGLWAVEIPSVVDFGGFIGLAVPSFEAHFTPCVEVGFRLARPLWGRGYATEGARAALDFGFAKLGLKEIVSFTVLGNQRSRAVMERIGMQRSEADEFDHPKLPEGHPLRRHALYRSRR